MKKIFVLFVLLISFVMTKALASDVANVSGATLYKDNTKTFVIDVIPNSPASEAGLPVGGEVLEINGAKTKPMTIDWINSFIFGDNKINITMLVRENRKELYTFAKTNVEDHRVLLDNDFLSVWKMVAPSEYVLAHKMKNFPIYSVELQKKIVINNFWVEKRNEFKENYRICKATNAEASNECIANLVSSTKSTALQEQDKFVQNVKNQQVIKNTVQNLEMNLDPQDFSTQIIKMHLGY